MFRAKAATACLGLASLGITLWAQVPAPPAPPQPPVAPRAPRARSANARGEMKRGYLGVGVVELTGERAKALNLKDDSGVEVKRVDENSPASKAGVKEGDVILEIDAQKVASIEHFVRMISETNPGMKIVLTVWRSGTRLAIPVTLDGRAPQMYTFAMPDMDDMRQTLDDMQLRGFSNGDVRMNIIPGQSVRMGFECETLTDQLAAFFGVKDGVLVRSVDAKSPAEKAGLKAGDVITKVNNTPVSTPREITAFVKAGRKLTLSVVRNRKELSLNVEVAAAAVPGNSRLVM